MRTHYLEYTTRKQAYPRGAVRVELTADSKQRFPRRAPSSFPGRNVGEAVAKLEKWSSKMLTEQTATTCRAVLSEAGTY